MACRIPAGELLPNRIILLLLSSEGPAPFGKITPCQHLSNLGKIRFGIFAGKGLGGVGRQNSG